MKPARAFLVAIAIASKASNAGGQAQGGRLPPFPAGSVAADLARDFLAGRSPTAADLIGEWRSSRQVATEPFRTGRIGPDVVTHDSTRLSFKRDASDKLLVLVGTLRQWSAARFNKSGDVEFGSDIVADVDIVFSCRLASSTRLICFDLAVKGAGGGWAFEYLREGRSRGDGADAGSPIHPHP